MKLKTIVSLMLVLVFVFALAGCGNTNSTSGTPENSAAQTSTAPAGTDAADTAPAETAAAPADDGKVYTINYATSDSTESIRFKTLEKPVCDLIEELSGGRIEVTVYPSGSIAGLGSIIQGCKDGVCDMGIDVPNFYKGSFPYNELLGTPGVKMGDTVAEKMANQQIYTEQYSHLDYENVFHLMCDYVSLDFYLNTNFPVNSLADLQGKTISTSPNFMGIFSGIGASAVHIDNADLYESIRLSVADGMMNGMGVISAFKIFEVANYAYKMPGIYGNTVFLMSQSAYDALPADLQAVIDEVSARIPEFVAEFLAQNQAAVEADTNNNPEFQYGALPADVVDGMDEACRHMLETKAAELDAAGLDGTGALELLMSFAD